MKRSVERFALALGLATALAACADELDEATGVDEEGQAVTASAIKYVFVIPMENHDAAQIYGNRADAPYINDVLLARYARGTLRDQLPSLVSEPHYVWMEAGTNAFADHTFTSDAAPGGFFNNSTRSPDHLVTQIKNATNGASWRSYQEGINSATGACPIAKSGFYAPKHNPFVFFQDVSGNPPSKSNAYCAAHHKDLSKLADDLASGSLAAYNFLTPNQCHDMHGQFGCSDSNTIRAGDAWLKSFLPPLIDFVNGHAGVIFLVWDEGDATTTMPFIAIGPGVKRGYASTVAYDHSSLVKSIERILELPILPRVQAANDLADLFQPGMFP